MWCLATMLKDFLPFSKDHWFKAQALIVFLLCRHWPHLIPQSQLFQACAGRDHFQLMLLFQGKEPSEDRQQSWQQVLCLPTFAVQVCSPFPRIFGVREHAQSQVGESACCAPLRVLDLDLGEKQRQPFPRFFSCRLLLVLHTNKHNGVCCQ